MFGYIYRTFCPSNGCFYIGQKSGSFRTNYFGSGTRILRWIKKYGKSSLIVDVLDTAPDKASLDRLEISYIRMYREFGFDLMNISDGGEGAIAGYKRPEWVYRKIGLAQKGKSKPLVPQAISAMALANRGKKRSAETINKIREKAIGRVMSPEARLAMSLARKGRKFHPLSQEHRDKIAESNRITKSRCKVQLLSLHGFGDGIALEPLGAIYALRRLKRSIWNPNAIDAG
jgi:hypothetical protein